MTRIIVAVLTLLALLLTGNSAFAIGWCVPTGTDPVDTYEWAEQKCAYEIQTNQWPNGFTFLKGCYVVPQPILPVGRWQWDSLDPDGVTDHTSAVDYQCASLTDAGNNNGCPSTGCSAGDPIHAGTGNLYVPEHDYSGGRWLRFDRYYNSDPSAAVAYTYDRANSVGPSTLGVVWRHTYSRNLTYLPGTSS